MSDRVFKLQLLARSELALAEIHARRAAARTTHIGFALAVLLLALGMLNVAGFFALRDIMAPALAALLVAIIDCAVAAFALHRGRSAGPAPSEEAMAREVRELSYREVSHDVEDMKLKLDSLTTEMSRIGEGVNRVAGTTRFLLSLLGKK